MLRGGTREEAGRGGRGGVNKERVKRRGEKKKVIEEGGPRARTEHWKTRRDRFIKVMADYFNIPMGVRARSIRCLVQFNNPRLDARSFSSERCHHYSGFSPRLGVSRRRVKNKYGPGRDLGERVCAV